MYVEMSFSLHLSMAHISSMESLLVGDTNSTQTMANSDFPHCCRGVYSIIAATFILCCLVPETHSHTMSSIVQVHVSVEEAVDSWHYVALPEPPSGCPEVLLTLDMAGWCFSLPCPLTGPALPSFSIKM